LLWAIEHQHQDIVAWLLSEDINISCYEVKKATLMKNTAILQLLFEKAWNINTAFGWDDPPALAYAVEDANLTAWFLAHGADPNASCPMDKTPLSAAVQYAPLSVVQMLFANGGNVERGQLLHAAIWRKLDDRKTMVEYVLQRGAAVNAVLYQNRPEIYLMREPFGLGTPLHAAAAIGDEDVLRVLIRHGAKLDIKDSRGFLAVERAEVNGHGSVAQFLRQ
ncbi:hypothetical protein CERZMDRAFT_2731, partial [Cercospora zeae-maydis SCOH1-5]